ncbi:MAG: efflux RND transporter periplasmic adaptor subunit [Deltaproteobacteria bacterium]|nr:efflux RND transporter periplasmic adaptor subunit [Deltaproteobacteria bacterium]
MRSSSALPYVALGALLACSSTEKPPSPPPPVTVAAPVKESELTTLTLTEVAEQRLAIATAKVERREVARTRSYPGRVEAVPGSGAAIAAPVAGTLVAVGPLTPGKKVERGEVLLRLQPLVAGEADALARGERDVAVARSRVETAQIRADRVAALVKEGASSQRAADDAVMELAVAKADLGEATARRDRIRQTPFAADVSLPLRAPESGTVLRLASTPGQVVAAGAPLVEIARIDRVWVRAAVYAGDVDAIAREQPAAVMRLGSRDLRAAVPVAMPALADPTSATIELVYAVDNPDAALLPGQRVLASLPMRGASVGLVVPLASVLYDVHGGAWVYVATAPRTYRRRRIEIRDITGDAAVLERGPEPGAAVVTTGASELYGAEFGSR